jgi:hypothetical protein
MRACCSQRLTFSRTLASQGIEGLPLVPTLFELIGIAFSAWFVYRYLLFKPDRCAHGARSARAAADSARAIAHADQNPGCVCVLTRVVVCAGRS